MLLFNLLTICVTLVLSYFLLCATIESYKKVSERMASQKYVSRASMLHENFFLVKKNSFENVPYIIKAFVQKGKTSQRVENAELTASSDVNEVEKIYDVIQEMQSK